MNSFVAQFIHTRLTMYDIRPFLYDIITVTVRFNPGFSTKCIGYNTNCIGAVMQSNLMGTNTHHISTLRRDPVTKCVMNVNLNWSFLAHLSWGLTSWVSSITRLCPRCLPSIKQFLSYPWAKAKFYLRSVLVEIRTVLVQLCSQIRWTPSYCNQYTS